MDLTDSSGETALHAAVRQEQLEIIDVLLAAKANVNVQNVHGRTPLHEAVSMGQELIVHKLLAADALIDIADEFEQTPLTISLFMRYPEIEDILMQHFINKNNQVEVYP